MHTTAVLQKTSMRETQGESKNFNGIDLVKFICAILVCIIHIDFIPKDLFSFAKYINFGFKHYICRLAVPFFFVSSGFFLFRKIDLQNLDTKRIGNYCFKIIRLAGICFIFLKAGGYGHLWYLGATVVAVLLLSVLLIKIKLKYIVLISVLLYIIGLFGDSYYAFYEPLRSNFIVNQASVVYEMIFESTRNGVFMGFIYVLMGLIFAQKKININFKLAVVGFVVSMMFLFAEIAGLIYFFDHLKDYNMYIFLLPATFFLFCLASNLNLKDRPLYTKLRSLSLLIYFLHMLAWRVVLIGNTAIDKFLGIDISDFIFIETMILVIAASVLIEYLSHKRGFGWLKYLYS